ncbi:MAG: DUF4384 domain-containing protein [candidate division KSB1 bacterium]|nr:DUF4384 domain-containing protein [candidate division KSB1 bacterium]MDZ7304476.1 DUF4384 domain-containing protein [candidate division KSB1 bacterium]MDZ7312983.1 DUF4384 domain-containing protein [candidate division KSB1 bacterium]
MKFVVAPLGAHNIVVPLLFIPALLFAQRHPRVDTTTTEGLASMAEMNQQQARTAALNEARAEAVRIVAGVKIRSESIGVKSESMQEGKTTALQEFFASVNRDVAYGHVVREEVLEEGPVTFANVPGKPPQLQYRVKIRAQVAVEQSEPDPTFSLQVKTNKDIYRENELMTINIKATQDCYVYVFNVMANDSLVVLFPNLYMQDNRLKADSSLHLMPVGLSLQVSLLPGMQRATELIYVVATKQRYKFAPEWRDEDEALRSTATKSFAFIELPRWLANIPPDKRTDRVVAYEVYRPGRR